MLYFADNTLAGAADTADVVQPELRSAGELGPQLPVTEALRRLDTVIPGIGRQIRTPPEPRSRR